MISSSSAPAPAAMSAPSARPQLGLKVAVVEKARRSAAPASTSAASRRRRCCTPPRCSRRRATEFRRSASWSARRSSTSPQMMEHKDDTVAANVNGVAFLFKKNKIDSVSGRRARIAGAGQGQVTGEDGADRTLEAKAIVIATGSDVARCPASRSTRSGRLLDRRAERCRRCPKKLIVVGAGVIGLELGSVWRRLGAEVTVVEFLDRILPGMDGEVAKQFQRMLDEAGLRVPPRSQGDQGREGRREALRRRSSRRPAATRSPRRRRRAGRDRPAPLHAGPRPRSGGRRDGPRAGRGRPAFRHQCPGHLRHRRRDPRADARPQGRGRGHRASPKSSPGRRAM